MPGYMGDKENMVVHHLANMKKECDIYQIKTNNRQYFTPDSLKTAVDLGFTSCKFCK